MTSPYIHKIIYIVTMQVITDYIETIPKTGNITEIKTHCYHDNIMTNYDKTLGLFILKAGKDTRFRHPVKRFCSGVIFDSKDNNKVLYVPPLRGQLPPVPANKVIHDTYIVSNLVDGTRIGAYFHDGKWKYATSKCTDVSMYTNIRHMMIGEEFITDNGDTQSYVDIIDRAFKRYGFDPYTELNREKYYSFILSVHGLHVMYRDRNPTIMIIDDGVVDISDITKIPRETTTIGSPPITFPTGPFVGFRIRVSEDPTICKHVISPYYIAVKKIAYTDNVVPQGFNRTKYLTLRAVLSHMTTSTPPDGIDVMRYFADIFPELLELRQNITATIEKIKEAIICVSKCEPIDQRYIYVTNNISKVVSQNFGVNMSSVENIGVIIDDILRTNIDVIYRALWCKH
jgi:hypothetical protein